MVSGASEPHSLVIAQSVCLAAKRNENQNGIETEIEIEKIDGPILKVDCVFQGKTEFPDWYKELVSKEDEDA